jgi:hypothetical protein
MPAETPDSATQRFTSEVMFTHSVRRDVLTCNVTMRRPEDTSPEELMSVISELGE